jgi:electron transfer flavoprotein beta subunit
VRIAVCTKIVPGGALELRLDPGTRRIVRTTGRSTINPQDRHAVEEAVRWRERLGEGEVVVVAMSPAAGFAAVREALAVGADRAVLVADESMAGSDLLATSRVLARALAREDPDLVLFGSHSDDGGGALMWAAVAERLGWPLLSHAVELELAPGQARIRRQTEHGYETLRAPTPCVVAVASVINQPRFASAKGMIAARRRPVAATTASDLQLTAQEVGEEGSGTSVQALGEPPTRAPARVVSGDDVAEQIYAFLHERRLVS